MSKFEKESKLKESKFEKLDDSSKIEGGSALKTRLIKKVTSRNNINGKFNISSFSCCQGTEDIR